MIQIRTKNEIQMIIQLDTVQCTQLAANQMQVWLNTLIVYLRFKICRLLLNKKQYLRNVKQLMIVQQDAVQCTEHTAWCNQINVGLVECTSIDIGRNV